jgi:hypothetical protein
MQERPKTAKHADPIMNQIEMVRSLVTARVPESR